MKYRTKLSIDELKECLSVYCAEKGLENISVQITGELSVYYPNFKVLRPSDNIDIWIVVNLGLVQNYIPIGDFDCDDDSQQLLRGAIEHKFPNFELKRVHFVNSDDGIVDEDEFLFDYTHR